MPSLPPKLTPAQDLLFGAQAVGDFLFPDEDPERRRRRVYHARETMRSAARPPLFSIGTTICARRSTLLAWLQAQERT